jgi:hypothetical protein
MYFDIFLNTLTHQHHMQEKKQNQSRVVIRLKQKEFLNLHFGFFLCQTQLPRVFYFLKIRGFGYLTIL